MKQNRMLFAFLVILIIVSIACGGAAPQEPTAAPTRTAVPTKTAEPTSAPDLGLQLASEKYAHKTGSISFFPPEGWTSEETANAISFFAPDGRGHIYANFTNTGYALDDPSFENFVAGSEQNNFSYYENYAEISRDKDLSAGEIWAGKNFDYEGVTQYTFTIYKRLENIIFQMDFWVNSDTAEEFGPVYDALLAEAFFDSAPVNTYDPYNFIYTFTSSSGLFTMDVPTQWIYSYNSGEGIVIESFNSPDNLAFMESIIFDDGSSQNAGTAGAGALALLNSYYTNGGGDIKVTKDEIVNDGSEKLTWTSKKGGYSGSTFFEVKNGTTILILSFVSSNDLTSLYQPVFDYALTTYVNK